MLFPYVYIPHPMEIMKHFLDFIFYEVWCKAPGSGPYDFSLFDDLPELKEVMESFHYSDAKGADFFNGHVERIYHIFSTLSAHQISQLVSWYEANNNLEKICCNDPSIAIVRYKDLEAFHTGLARHLTAFFKGLYSQDLLNLSALREKISQIDDHYKKFILKNNSGKCPFCGIMDIKGVYHSKREAYDHYLPKSIYPFNSINFKNLVPACHECNSTYKLSKDPVYKPKDPLLSATKGIRKAFYPYANRSYQIKLQLDLKCNDWSDITPKDIAFSAGPDELKEEISTWNDVYGIEERYKAKCCGENDGKGWIREVVDESQNYGLSPLEYLDGKLKTAENDPWVDDNFLKKPFLQACQKAGLFGK